MRRDRLRELLDAALGAENTSVEAMARDVFASPFHFSRQVSDAAGEGPAALRRRVLLERAAWRLGQGTPVADVATEAGYESAEGFSRAYARAWGYPPSATVAGTRTWLDAPNGIHFHPPTNLWVSRQRQERAGMQLTAHLIHHDLADTRSLILAAAALDPAQRDAVALPGLQVLAFNGPEESLAAVLGNLVHGKEVWLAALAGERLPQAPPNDVPDLLERHDRAAAAWVAELQGIDERDAWGDQFVDALCEPPQSFVLSSVVAHVLTYAAGRRLLARHLLRLHGVEPDDGDPIMWLREGSRDQEER
ncbi:helix-turn-helix domain-containing protein [Nocardioides dubius]|uniref:AraC family transcriptional regulator n=1 Tax=Nocardioides dubius TaxID=317019 RepID=A0ABP4EAG2_9ACTN